MNELYLSDEFVNAMLEEDAECQHKDAMIIENICQACGEVVEEEIYVKPDHTLRELQEVVSNGIFLF